MSCRNLRYKLDELRRCGCRRCEEEYYHMRDGYERNFRVSAYDYQRAVVMPSITAHMFSAATPKELKMEEPKNIAIKILVDKLKAEQGNLSSNATMLKSHEDNAKIWREKKSKNQKAIKELAAALKKLVHKDA